jgi:hypothetical protein
MLKVSLRSDIAKLSILILVTILVIVASQKILAQPLAQPQLGPRICAESPVQPTDPIQMSSVLHTTGFVSGLPVTNSPNIHTVKEIFDCRSLAIPPQPKFKLDVTLITTWAHGVMVFFNSTICQRTNEGDITTCRTPSIPVTTTSNLTRCNESIVHNPEVSRNDDELSYIPQGHNSFVTAHTGGFTTAETHVYKCFSGNVQLPNKIKVMTLFTSVYLPAYSTGVHSMQFLKTTCVEDIRSARVESCQWTGLPSH